MTETLNTHVAQRMKAMREAIGFTQQQIATAMGVTQATVSRWERADIPIAIEDLEQFANIGDIHVSYFFEDYTQGLQDMHATYIIEGNA